jgi:hypothetical protein
MQDNTNPFDLGGTESTPEVDSGIPQDLGGELDIQFVNEEPEPQVEARRGQNEPVEPDDTPDERATEREEWQRERLQAIEREEQMANHAINVEVRRVATEREAAKVAIESTDLKIATLVEALKAAKHDGDTSAEVDFQQQLAEARQLRSNIVQAAHQLPTEDQIKSQGQQWVNENISARRQQAQQLAQRAVAPAQGNDLAARYIQHNGWMNSNAQARTYAMAASNMLAAEGIDPKSPEHFVELSKRVAQKYPSLAVKSADGRAIGVGAVSPSGQPRSQNSPPVASARGATSGMSPGGQAPSARRGVVSITQQDSAIMRKMGLDPSNKQVQQRYAKEKLARLQSEGRR